MSEKIVVKDLQKQDPGSALVYLYEIEYAKDSFAYFHDGLDSSLSEVTMLDFKNNSQTNTYTALPVQVQGMDRTAANKLAQPTISFANVLSVFKTQVANIDYMDFIGLRVIRRTTLRKYLKSEGDSNSPPIEYPRDVYFIDHIKERNKSAITFQLQSPFDVQGVKLPGRTIVPNQCPWIYQGASEHTENPEFRRARSGCNWHIESKYTPFYDSTVLNDGTTYTVYVNIDDEYLVPSTTSFTLHSGMSGSASVSKGDFIRTTSTATRLNANGSITTGVTVNNYWQATSAGTVTSLGTPSDTNASYNRIRTYTTYSHGTEYFTYKDDQYNDYVIFQDNTAAVGAETYQKTLLWKTKAASVSVPPAHGEKWQRRDACGKRLKSCGMRFGFEPKSVGTATSPSSGSHSTQVVIPFGGFPGSKAFS